MWIDQIGFGQIVQHVGSKEFIKHPLVFAQLKSQGTATLTNMLTSLFCLKIVPQQFACRLKSPPCLSTAISLKLDYLCFFLQTLTDRQRRRSVEALHLSMLHWNFSKFCEGFCIEYLSSECRFRFLFMMQMTLMTMMRLNAMTRMTGKAKNQMLSPLSIQQLEGGKPLIIFFSNCVLLSYFTFSCGWFALKTV